MLRRTVFSNIIENMSTEAKKLRKSLQRRKHTIFQKAYELGKFHGVEVAVTIYGQGRFYTFRTTDHPSWPPSMKQIVMYN